MKDGFLIKTLPSHQSFFKSVQFSPDSKALLSSDKNQTVILWNLDPEHLLQEGCDRLQDYLKTNPKVKKSDRQICDNL
ncbi:MAG: hypothetical protein F6K50_48595 [Moorea sp. SIO3I7]|nr:hypothetical protein [Moorena sp. SIO3I7]